MTLLDSWETLVDSLSNNPNLTFDGRRGSILNEEIKRKASGEGSGSTNVARGRTEKKSENVQRNRSKSKGKAEVTCHQCGRKGHTKPDCRYYKAEFERRTQVTRRKNTARMKHITALRTRTKRRPMCPLVSSLRSHQMQKILFVLPWQ